MARAVGTVVRGASGSCDETSAPSSIGQDALVSERRLALKDYQCATPTICSVGCSSNSPWRTNRLGIQASKTCRTPWFGTTSGRCWNGDSWKGNFTRLPEAVGPSTLACRLRAWAAHTSAVTLKTETLDGTRAGRTHRGSTEATGTPRPRSEVNERGRPLSLVAVRRTWSTRYAPLVGTLGPVRTAEPVRAAVDLQVVQQTAGDRRFDHLPLNTGKRPDLDLGPAVHRHAPGPQASRRPAAYRSMPRGPSPSKTASTRSLVTSTMRRTMHDRSDSLTPPLVPPSGPLQFHAPSGRSPSSPFQLRVPGEARSRPEGSLREGPRGRTDGRCDQEWSTVGLRDLPAGAELRTLHGHGIGGRVLDR